VSPQVSARPKPFTPVRVLLCDGVAIRRAVIRDFLEEDGEIVVGEVVGAIDNAPRAERVDPDVVIITAPELQIGEAVLPADAHRVTPSAAILVLGACDQRRVVAQGVVELPRSTSLAQLRNEVIAAAGPPSARQAAIPLLNRPGKRA
jgi:DNA-binding NarL/FixJ family response regulator